MSEYTGKTIVIDLGAIGRLLGNLTAIGLILGLLATLFAGTVGVLTGGFQTTYETNRFAVSEKTIGIFASEKPGWIEDIWENDRDRVIFTFNREAGEFYRESEEDPYMSHFSYDPLEQFAQEAKIKVLEVQTSANQARALSQVKVAVLFKGQQQPMTFVRSTDGRWFDASAFVELRDTGLKALADEAERAYLAWEYETQLKPEFETATSEK